MISVVIPTLNAEKDLPSTLSALVPAAIEGVVSEVIIVDGGSGDKTCKIADDAGAVIVSTSKGRGRQFVEGARRARHPWLLFLHGDTILDPSWSEEVTRFIIKVEQGRLSPAAAAFRFRLDDQGVRPRLLERLVRWRCALFHMPYGDQGLLMQRSLYHSVGGFKPLPLMEDVDLVRRLGYQRIHMLQTDAVTSAKRYKRDGYFRRVVRNFACIMLFYMRVSPQYLHRLYD